MVFFSKKHTHTHTHTLVSEQPNGSQNVKRGETFWWQEMKKTAEVGRFECHGNSLAFYFVWFHSLILCLRVLTKSHKWKEGAGTVNNSVSIVLKRLRLWFYLFIGFHSFTLFSWGTFEPPEMRLAAGHVSVMVHMIKAVWKNSQCEWCWLLGMEGIDPLSDFGGFWRRELKTDMF